MLRSRPLNGPTRCGPSGAAACAIITFFLTRVSRRNITMSLSDDEIRRVARRVRRLSRINTLMSNERTFLVYIRTSLTFLVAGVTILHFFMGRPYRWLGWILVGVAACALIIGCFRHARMRCQILYEDAE